MRNISYALLIISFLISSCAERIDDVEAPREDITDYITVSEPLVHRDLAEIKEDSTLRAIMVYSGISYFLYRGEPMGYEYELVQRLAKELNVKLEIVLANNINELIDMLNRGEGDIIAHGLTVTQRRREFVRFMDYLYLTHQVLIQRKPANWRQMKLHEIQKELKSDPIELIGETISVRRNSAYYSRLLNLKKEIGGGFYIDTISGELSTQKAIKMVVDGKIKYTVSDNNIAELNNSHYPILDVKTPISFSQRIAWAVRKNSPELQTALNEWVKKMRKDVDYYVIYNKYFKNSRSYRKRISSDYYSEVTGKISPYDSIIKYHANRINWDWRFLSSLIFHESRFNPNEKSWAGAVGLMQLMPSTAQELGITNTRDPKQNIRAGTTYLQNMWNRWEEIPDSTQRLKFTLASYNCGYSHVKDAQRLTAKYERNPNIWDKNVEVYVLNLMYPEYFNDELVYYGYVMGQEPVDYVNRIFDLYDHYKTLLPE
ncbi:MAG: transporter substrate-binding domain-containing protein [Prolixibacteraceae bacterium]|jgi:membrane-bound lytic murein transglycosylase F|nr:transporter substrate-binding domain-containing protein [Prolixibacteraceae bacterium]